MNIHRVYAPLMRGFRRRRMARFASEHAPGRETVVLDVGGDAFNWDLAGIEARITLLNLRTPKARAEHFAFVTASGTALPYRDASVDVVFSNSVIEHLGSFEAQQAFARELRRVGRALWVQTPARGFPVEPHLLGVGIHYLPERWQRRLIPWLTGWGWIARPTPAQVEGFLAETRLLDAREFAALFPDCEIRRERVLGLTKAFVAVRRPVADPPP